MSNWQRETTKTIVDNYGLILVCLLVIAALGGYLTYTTHVEPGTDTATRQLSSWQSSGSFSHNATVRNGTSAFVEGTVLQDRSVYLTHVAPLLSGSFTYTYGVSNESNLAVDTTVLVRYRSVESAGSPDELVYWQVKQTLAHGRDESLSPDESMTIPFSLNISDAAETVRRIDREHGGTPGQLDMTVVARVDLSGTRNGQHVDTTRTYLLPIDPSQNSYRVEDADRITHGDERTVDVTVDPDYGLLRQVGSPLLFLFGTVGAGFLVFARSTGQLSLSNREQRWLAYQSTREEFNDWITTGQIDQVGDDVWSVTVDSLEGLVDVAIDTDNRVIEQRGGDEFVVFTGDRLFRYRRPPEPETNGEFFWNRDEGRTDDSDGS
ncbi:hypothetical protein E6P09_17345 (plasmid) [Haloferax mediterranei ATCC 33500]|uniref:DUF5305 domain-containing protein n=1 Tax=Haloferax mediterranei (strain ATCC 33500 / DSM 1411 / JCM 8866 / NBRC 14739 / NCIMB 2177 / R-4) TaxID=523841 RepID=I3RAG0_HALMT|nr:DUF5305 domain-containing protein [Haloferax mediterranei]AFK21220.1 hypothetical protein HFX_6094 [Haloferax mediterranei ATCC 33500]AHZ24673.1 hypothetical protein BM92_17465 [Haloferax mediterranei ATCC 33500]ELZ97448.1 hypothetical protein C439_19038 [Haloferax mediterranei ATCC 33500]MDX5990261.1 DUF5305 domain-containing protein [Haloferax mediterranei ATCC 33500]QCQ77067.1 hypothetical protein E6P09_17345 [Haloferax mediterranei ATCC 33500]